MKDKLITLAALLFLGLMLGAILDGAKAQNQSMRGMPYSKAYIRKALLLDCMKLVDDLDRQRCVEKIK